MPTGTRTLLRITFCTVQCAVDESLWYLFKMKARVICVLLFFRSIYTFLFPVELSFLSGLLVCHSFLAPFAASLISLFPLEPSTRGPVAAKPLHLGCLGACRYFTTMSGRGMQLVCKLLMLGRHIRNWRQQTKHWRE